MPVPIGRLNGNKGPSMHAPVAKEAAGDGGFALFEIRTFYDRVSHAGDTCMWRS